MRRFGDIVRERRQVMGWSQAELAQRAGLSLNQVNRLERGVISDPRFSTTASLGRALGIRYLELWD